MGAPVAALIIRKKENDLIQHFRDLGAISPETAKSLQDLHLEEDDYALRRLQRRAVIREIHAGEHYLDEEVWQAVQNTRRRLGFVIVALIVIGGIMMYLRSSSRGAPLT